MAVKLKSKSFKKRIVVTLETDSEVSGIEITEYVANAINYWGAQYNANHPLFVERILSVRAVYEEGPDWVASVSSRSGLQSYEGIAIGIDGPGDGASKGLDSGARKRRR